MTRTDLRRPTGNRARSVLVVGLVVAALGTLGEYLTGVPGFPVVPPGPIILVVAAVVVALLPWRWAPAVGLVAALFILVGALVSGVPLTLLLTPGVVGQFLSALVQFVGLLVAVGAGVVALTRAVRRP
jgi:hypothetical protein